MFFLSAGIIYRPISVTENGNIGSLRTSAFFLSVTKSNMKLQRFIRPEFVHRPSQLLRAVRQKIMGDPTKLVRCVLPWGMPVTVDIHDFIGHSVYRHGLTALEACETVFRLVEAGDTVLDVGANQGIVTSAMVKCATPGGRVFAVEMLPETFERLSNNIQSWGPNASQAVVAVNGAASSENGEIGVGLSDDFASNSGVAYVTRSKIPSGHKSRRVSCTRLDEMVDRSTSIKLLKLDVERHEYDALVGAANLLARKQIHHIIFEDEDGHSRVKALLEESGYDIYSVELRLAKPYIKRFLRTTTDTNAANADLKDFIATSNRDYLESRFKASGYLCLRG